MRLPGRERRAHERDCGDGYDPSHYAAKLTSKFHPYALTRDVLDLRSSGSDLVVRNLASPVPAGVQVDLNRCTLMQRDGTSGV
jgi:hypothetical protein